MGLVYIKPNFIFLPLMSTSDIVIDAGCSYEADFSVHMLSKYNVCCYAVDPTRKHSAALRKLERDFSGRFNYMPIALGPADGEVIFYESELYESGSLMEDHTNVRRDKTVSYAVRTLTLPSLLKEIGIGIGQHISILKLDIEGAEYLLLNKIASADLEVIDQLFVEFHHHAIARYSVEDTLNIVHRLKTLGFKSFSLDDHNYLFWRS